MKPLLFCLALVATVAATGEEGLAGRWLSAKGSSPEIKLGFTPKENLWSVSHSWSSPNAMAMNTADYLLTGTDAAGSFAMAKEKDSSVPARFTFARKGDTLTITVPGGDFAGQHQLTRFSLTTAAAAKALAKAGKKPATTRPKLIGKWNGSPDAPVQASLTISPGKSEQEVLVTQQWHDESSSVMGMNTAYEVQIQDGRCTLEKVNSGLRTSAPAVMSILVDGNALLVTLPTGSHAGTHLLTKG